MKKLIILLCIINTVLMFDSVKSQAQLLDKLKKTADKTVDKQIDKTLNSTKEKKDKSSNESTGSDSTPSETQSADVGEPSNSDKKEDYTTSYKSKFDFVPGEKVLISDDFSQDAVGDFPALWFTNGSGEVVNIDDKEGKWLMLKERSSFYIDQLLELPDNFTIQFDVMCSAPYSWNSGIINFLLVDIKELDRYRKGDNGSEATDFNINHTFKFDLHPGQYNPGTYTSKGYGHYKIKTDGANIDLKEKWMPNAEKNLLKVSIWRQKQRLRVYLNEEKILDLPKILPAEMKPNLFVFETAGLIEPDNYFIGNLRIAVGNPDTRNKLLTDGKLVTNGILFNVNSDQIKSESYGVLKEIAGILNENPEVKVEIVGHTDSDGDEVKNLELSKKRAEAVKNALSKDFAIDNSRMKTAGKGESDPLEPNTTSINKANNRRVEFLKTDG
jgi:outer membrane protein OmpA-like peptidoglycan-associated protein